MLWENHLVSLKGFAPLFSDQWAFEMQEFILLFFALVIVGQPQAGNIIKKTALHRLCYGNTGTGWFLALSCNCCLTGIWPGFVFCIIFCSTHGTCPSPLLTGRGKEEGRRAISHYLLTTSSCQKARKLFSIRSKEVRTSLLALPFQERWASASHVWMAASLLTV